MTCQEQWDQRHETVTFKRSLVAEDMFPRYSGIHKTQSFVHETHRLGFCGFGESLACHLARHSTAATVEVR